MRFLVHISTPWTFMLVESTQLQMWNFRIFESRIEATRAPCSVQETSCCMNPGRCLVEPPVRRWNNSGSMVDGWHFTTIFSWYLGIIRRCLLWKSFPGGAWLQSQADWHFSCCWSLVPWRWRVTQSCNLLLVLCAQVGNPEMSWPGWLIINGDTATNLHSSNMPRLPTYCLPSDANYRNERSTSIHVLLWPSFAIHRQVLKTCFHKMGVRISWRLGYWTRWWFQIFFIFTTILGRFPLTNIFQMGWNHQPVNQCRPRQQFHHVVAMLGFVALPPMLWTLTKLHPGERRLPELWCYVGISVQMMEMYGNTNATNQHLCFLQVFLLQSLTLELRHLGWICIPIGLVLAGAFKDLADLTFQHSQSAECPSGIQCFEVLGSVGRWCCVELSHGSHEMHFGAGRWHHFYLGYTGPDGASGGMSTVVLWVKNNRIAYIMVLRYGLHENLGTSGPGLVTVRWFLDQNWVVWKLPRQLQPFSSFAWRTKRESQRYISVVRGSLSTVVIYTKKVQKNACCVFFSPCLLNKYRCWWYIFCVLVVSFDVA